MLKEFINSNLLSQNISMQVFAEKFSDVVSSDFDEGKISLSRFLEMVEFFDRTSRTRDALGIMNDEKIAIIQILINEAKNI